MAACPNPIRELREMFELSQVEVSKNLGMHQPVYSMVESGKKPLDDETLMCLGVAIVEMVRRDAIEKLEMVRLAYEALPAIAASLHTGVQ